MESKLVVTIVTIILIFCFVSIVVFKPSRYKPMALLLLPVIIVCIVYIFTRKPNYSHTKTAQYRQPEQEKVNKYIQENLSPSPGLKIGFVYITYHDLDSIPQDVMENIKKYCRGYYINFYSTQKCEDFIYDYYGPDCMHLYRELKDKHKNLFWAYCILYAKGGYYIDIKSDFQEGHISDKKIDKNGIYSSSDNSLIVSKLMNPLLWDAIVEYIFYKSSSLISIPIENKLSENIVWMDDPDDSIQKLSRIHNKLDKINKDKIDIPILFINLDKSTDRLKYINEQLEGVSKPVVRVPGVMIKEKDMYKYTRKSEKNVIGCYLAHVDAMKELIKRGWDRALIIEDDACFKLSNRWPNKLSELKYPAWLSQGCTAYIIDSYTAIDFISYSEGRRDFIDGVDTVMNKRYGDNTMNTWTEYVYNGWANYPYIYPSGNIFQTTIAGHDSRYADCERSIFIINSLSRFISYISIFPSGDVVKEYSKPILKLIIKTHFYNSDLHTILNNYKDHKIELYYTNPNNILNLKLIKNIKVFDISYSNINENSSEIYIHNKNYGEYEGNIGFTKSGITTIITTAPHKAIPSPKFIEQTIRSLEKVPLFRDSHVIIGFDGCQVINKDLHKKCTQEFSCELYNTYKNNVKKIAHMYLPWVTFVELPERGCLSTLLFNCMTKVDTEFVNVMQQDLPIIKGFNAPKIINIMKNNITMDLVRYSDKGNKIHEDYTKKECKNTLPQVNITLDGINFSQCSQWSDQNHIAKLEHYKYLVWTKTNPLSFMEDQLMCYPVGNNYKRIWYLGDINDGYYSDHTDGRNV